jgi:hypothetical protein
MYEVREGMGKVCSNQWEVAPKPKKGTIYDIVPKAKQQEAMQWLQANAFASPTWLVNVSTLKNIDYAGYTERPKFASQTFECTIEF